MLAFTNNERLMDEDGQRIVGVVPTITATVYRGTPPMPVYGPAGVNVQPVKSSIKDYLRGLNLVGVDQPTHKLYVDYQLDDEGNEIPFVPLLKTDVVYVEGSRGKFFDGWYGLNEWRIDLSNVMQLEDADLDCMVLRCRFTGPENSGDVFGEDNSPNIMIEGQS